MLGVAWVNRLCAVKTASKYPWDHYFSAGVNEANFPSKVKIAAIIAHETGHNMGMFHDAADAAVKNLMSPSVASAPADENLEFSLLEI